MTDDLLAGKQGAETIALAFTDPLAVSIRLKLTAPNVHRGRGRWRMNTTLLNDESFQMKIWDSWEEWKQHIGRFPDIVQWWVHYMKQKVKSLFIQEGAERNADWRRMEEFYYSAIYDVLQVPEPHTDKMLKLKRLKAKIVRLNSPYRQRVMVDTEEHDQIAGEYPFLHHLLKSWKRQENRLIRQIIDENEETHTTSASILRAFATHFQQALQPIETKEQSVKQLTESGLQTITSEMREALTQPISIEELWKAVSQGKHHKARGIDGISLEFYKAEWDVIKTELLQVVNNMFTNGPILARQVQGQIVCIPKKSQPDKIGDYRPLTLLNADHKILARIIANRLKPLLQKIPNPHQHCRIPGTTVFDAVVTIRDTIAYAETKKVPLRAVSLDFQSAFDKISHNYLQEILQTYSFGNLFVD